MRDDGRSLAPHTWVLIIGGTIVAICIALAIALGCVSVPDEHSWVISMDTYATTLDTLNTLRADGKITQEQAVSLEPYRKSARESLDAWKEALDKGANPQASVEAYQKAMASLISAIAEAQK